jgi:hypothetical protein
MDYNMTICTNRYQIIYWIYNAFAFAFIYRL